VEEVLQFLDDKLATVEATGPFGDTPILAAAANGHHELVEELAVRGADIHRQDWWGNTPLILAAAAGESPTVDALLRQLADPELPNFAGKTAVQVASSDRVRGLVLKVGGLQHYFGLGRSRLTALLFWRQLGDADMDALASIQSDVSGQKRGLITALRSFPFR
jgi:uncharacterized protein